MSIQKSNLRTDRQPDKEILLAEFYLTGEFLNDMVRPALIRRYPLLQGLLFEVKHGCIYVSATGKYLFLKFRVDAAFEITSLIFNHRRHRLDFNAVYQVKPAYISLLQGNPLAKILQEQPGVSVQGSRVTVDLDSNPHFNLLRQFKYRGEEMLSLFELTWEGAGDRGLAFKLTLNRDHVPVQ